MAIQTLTFLYSVAFGFFIGFLYDLFRISRIAIKTSTVFVFIQDVIFFILVTVQSFIFIVIKNEGALRGFLIIGELLGTVIYFFSLSVLVIKAAKVIITAVKSVLKFLYKLIIKPLLSVYNFIKRFVKKFKNKVIIKQKQLKNSYINSKTRKKHKKSVKKELLTIEKHHLNSV